MKGLIPILNRVSTFWLCRGRGSRPAISSQRCSNRATRNEAYYRGRRGEAYAPTYGSEGDRRPTNDAKLLQPFHLMICRANISPKPSITPLMNGKKRLIVREESNARTRARRERDELNIESVTEGGGTGGLGGGGFGAPKAWANGGGTCGGVLGKDNEGYEDSVEPIFSQVCELVVGSSPDPETVLGCSVVR